MLTVETVRLQSLVELIVGDARLKDCHIVLGVDMHNFVHPGQVDCYTFRAHRGQ